MFGNVLMDTSLLGSQWINAVTEAISISSDLLAEDPLKPSNEIHGAALLGGICIKLIRLHPTLVRTDSYDMASKLWDRLGSALTNVDDLIGNVFCDAILLSCSGGFTIELHDR